MGARLVEHLVDAGLVTEAQARASDAGDPLLPSAQVVQNLVAAGLDERALAGFFVSQGFGPMLQSKELARADGDLVRRLRGVDAHDLCAMPLRPSPAGAIVAMADPTDESAVAKLSEALGGSILPTVAKLSDLLASIDRAYPPERQTLVTDPVAVGSFSNAERCRAAGSRKVGDRRRTGRLGSRPFPLRACIDRKPRLGSRVEPLRNRTRGIADAQVEPHPIADRLSSSHRSAKSTPRPVTPTPRPVTPTPRPVTPTPRRVTPTPRRVTPTPRRVTPTPRPVTPSNHAVLSSAHVTVVGATCHGATAEGLRLCHRCAPRRAHPCHLAR